MSAEKDHLAIISFGGDENFQDFQENPTDSPETEYIRELAIFSMDIYVALAHLSKLAENILDWRTFKEFWLIYQAQQKFVNEIRDSGHNQGLYRLVNDDRLTVFDTVVKQKDITYLVQIREDPTTKKRVMLVFIPTNGAEQGTAPQDAFNTVISIDWRDFASKEFYLPRIIAWQRQLTTGSPYWELKPNQPVDLDIDVYFGFIAALTDVVSGATAEML